MRFPGTGDIFTAIVAGKALRGKCLEDAVHSAMKTVSYLIVENESNIDK